MKIYLPNGEAPKPGEIFRNPDLARTLEKLVEAERADQAKGRHEALEGGARPLLQRRHRARICGLFRGERRDCSVTRTSPNTPPRSRTPVSINYRGYQIYKNPSATPGADGALCPEHPRGL